MGVRSAAAPWTGAAENADEDLASVYERVSVAACTTSTRTTDAVNIIFICLGRVEIDHV